MITTSEQANIVYLDRNNYPAARLSGVSSTLLIFDVE